MFRGLKNGWAIIKESIKIFNHYPKLLVPILFAWLIYAPILLFLKYIFNWDRYSTNQILLIVLGVIFIFAFLLSFTCSILLELIQQLKSGEKLSLTKAFFDTLAFNLIKIIPLVIVWTIVWFVLTVIEAFLSRSEDKEDGSLTAENAAKTLAGYESISLSRAFFVALEKGIRMIVFLILPGIAWENLGSLNAAKKGFSILRARRWEFVGGFLLTDFAATIIFLPPTLLFYISEKFKVTFPDIVWYVTIVFVAFAWSYSIYLEQMFTAELYLWHLKWEKQVIEAQKLGKTTFPSFEDIKKPSLLDDIHELSKDQ